MNAHCARARLAGRSDDVRMLRMMSVRLDDVCLDDLDDVGAGWVWVVRWIACLLEMMRDGWIGATLVIVRAFATHTHAVRSISRRAGSRGDLEGAGHFVYILFLFVSSSVYFAVNSTQEHIMIPRPLPHPSTELCARTERSGGEIQREGETSLGRACR